MPQRDLPASLGVPRIRQPATGQTRLLVASTGGHLVEMLALAPRLRPVAPHDLWVTFDSQQSRSLLAGQDVQFIRDTPPRDWRAVLHNVDSARRIFNEREIGSVVSTGAGIALSFLPPARVKRMPAHYIESSARVEGPSLTGRLLQQVPGVRLYTQYKALAGSRWRHSGSIFDSYERLPIQGSKPLRKVVVTVGTLPFPYFRLFARLRAILPTDVTVLVQSGAAGVDIAWPNADIRTTMPPEELRLAMVDADAVVAHAGIGSLLMAFEAGKFPILVPRLLRHREHVDDHQVQIARALAAEGLVLTAEAESITFEDLLKASACRLKRSTDSIPFRLS